MHNFKSHVIALSCHVTFLFYYSVDANVNGVQLLVDMRFIFVLLDFVKASTGPLSSSPKPPDSKVEPDFEEDVLAPRPKSENDDTVLTPASKPPPKKDEGSLVVQAAVKKVLVALLEYREVMNPRTLVLQVRETIPSSPPFPLPFFAPSS